MSDFSTFTSIRLLDSTTFTLPKDFASTYEGSGGSGSPSAMSIQQEIDILGNRFYPPIIHSGKENEALHKAHYPPQEQEMIIRDLGYWNMAYFNEIHQAKAYFLTRFKYHTQAVFVKDRAGNFIKIDFKNYLRKVVKSQGSGIWEWEVFLGKDKIPVRMMMQKLPEQVIEQRLRKKQAKYRKNLDKDYRLFHQVNIFITNAPKERLKSDDIWQLYRVRWQIELLFKTWKSYAKIQEYKKMSIHRFEAMLYAKLIWLLFAHRIYIEIQTSIWQQKRADPQVQKEISLLKLTKVFYLQQSEDILKAIQENQDTALKKIRQSFEKDALKLLQLEVKNKQKSTFKVLTNP